ncbi:uncharacterized protein A4U43_C01F23740 [Asparagus officinalis]|uniref:Uncharacterized protein n=1 Tax=Asparagus officinalis TaxID=4686 RepID=A0A5P1FVW1_ASPOF|nr:uncharacterized protein A4U43_C01F23740 [Asparagus officinalis]
MAVREGGGRVGFGRGIWAGRGRNSLSGYLEVERAGEEEGGSRVLIEGRCVLQRKGRRRWLEAGWDRSGDVRIWARWKRVASVVIRAARRRGSGWRWADLRGGEGLLWHRLDQRWFRRD